MGAVNWIEANGSQTVFLLPRVIRVIPGIDGVLKGEKGITMHELGIVLHTAKTVEAFAEENGITDIQAVTLEVGEVSGIIHTEFVNCWNYFRHRYPAMAEAELRLEIIPAETWCDDCGQVYGTVEHGRICPYCGSERTWLLRGNECYIRDITVPDLTVPDESDAASA